MSNFAFLYRVERPKTQPKESGYNLGDDYGEETRFIDIEGGAPEDDLELLRYVVNNCEENGQAVLDFIQENQNSICINGVTYGYDKIKDILEETED